MTKGQEFKRKREEAMGPSFYHMGKNSIQDNHRAFLVAQW